MSRASRVLSLARNRRPPTRFADRPVPHESLACVLDCARYAPSAKEAQPWRFVVVRDPITRREIAGAAFGHPHVRTAPILVVCCARIHSHVSGTGRPSHPADLAAAAQSMMLAAFDLGLSASWIPGFREMSVRKAVGVPADVPIPAIVAIGYPDGLERLPARRPREEVVAWDQWAGE